MLLAACGRSPRSPCSLRALCYLQDLQRKLELESLAIAAPVVPQLYFTAWVLQRFGLIQLDAEPALAWVFACIVVVRAAAGMWLRRRYQ